MVYKVEIDSFDRKTWENCTREFADYSIYQTWPYQENRARMSGQSVMRVIIRNKSDKVCLMCQVRIKNIPLIGLKVGYVQWGPLVRRWDDTTALNKEILDMLRDALFEKGINIIRVIPRITDKDDDAKAVALLTEAHFQFNNNKKKYQTFHVDVSDNEEGIRRRLRKSFRRDLKKAEKVGFEIKSGCQEDLFSILTSLYNESKQRKGFTGLEIEEFAASQIQLIDSEKMDVLVALYEGRPASALLSTNLGDTAIVLLAASNELGLKYGSSYLLWYKAALIAWEAGLKWCDLGGIDPDANPNVYEFKSRLGGNNISHIGVFDCCKSNYQRLIWNIVMRFKK